jgi:RHS repeat-associated protein
MNYWDSDSYPSGFSHTMSYTYDHLNRLATATAKSLGGSTLWSYAYSYDRWGNGTCTQGGVDCPSLVYNSNNNNQLATIGSSLFSYDAAGNLTTDPSNALATHTYQWDAEGRVSVVDPGSSPTWSFTYNAVGDRVTWTHSGSADQHIFDPAGNFLGVNSVWDLAWLGGRLVTVYLGSNTYFSHPNHLGSTTAWADYTGKQVEDLVFYPWGGVWQYSGSGGYMFAGMPYYETTTETSPANYRFYSMNVGRWHSPDPVGGDISNPQSLNRYAYVMNNHTTLTDPLGLGQCPPGTAGQGCNPEQASQSNWLGMGIDPFDECSYTNTVDASCALPPGLWENGTPIFGGSIGGNSVSLELGNVGGGFGTGPLSGDFGPLGYPSAGGWGPPCEFGSCGSGVPGLSGSGFEGVIPQEGVVPIFTSTVWACAFNPACLAVGGAIAVGAAYQIGTMYVSSLIGQAIGARILQAKGGSQNVGHDYIRDEARQLAKELNISYCEALQMIYQAARAAGNFKKANDTKATQKQDGCRGH